ncbi:MAG: VOC family protein [Pseudomonadota bacterium]
MAQSLTPELYVSDLGASLDFYCGLLGFEVEYGRPEERFAYLSRGAVSLMIEEPIGRTWLTGSLERPFGRGMNLQIMVEDVRALYAACEKAGAVFFLSLETKAYQRRDDTVSQTQFVVQDPDGYLIRLAQIEP